MSRWYDERAERIGGLSLDPFWRTRRGKVILLGCSWGRLWPASVLGMRFACSAGADRRGRQWGTAWVVRNKRHLSSLPRRVAPRSWEAFLRNR